MTVVERPISSAVIVTSDNRDQLLAGAPMSFRLVCNLVSRIKFGALTFVLPDGPALKFVGGEEPSAEGVIVVKDYAFARRKTINTRRWRNGSAPVRTTRFWRSAPAGAALRNTPPRMSAPG
jgi:hypothetical protein